MADNPYQEKAAARPIDGQFKALAEAVRELLGWNGGGRPFLSTRAAEFKTGISNGTIATMARGGRVHPDTLSKFARAMGDDPVRLQVLGGYISPETLVRQNPLLRIGQPVDLSQFERISVSTRPASAGNSLGDGDGGEEPASNYISSGVEGIRLQGDCMEPHFRQGDVLFIKRQEDAENGQKVIALLDDGSVTCKVYKLDEQGRAYLNGTNGAYPSITEGFKIVGIVAQFLRAV